MDALKMQEYSTEIHQIIGSLNQAIRRAAMQGILIELDSRDCETVGWPVEYPQFVVKVLKVIEPYREGK